MNKTFSVNLPIPPGTTLREILKFKKMTQQTLAYKMQRPVKTISEIVNGKARITEETAYQLERKLGTLTAEMWLNLEANYRIAIERQKHIGTKSKK